MKSNKKTVHEMASKITNAMSADYLSEEKSAEILSCLAHAAHVLESQIQVYFPQLSDNLILIDPLSKNLEVVNPIERFIQSIAETTKDDGVVN